MKKTERWGFGLVDSPDGKRLDELEGGLQLGLKEDDLDFSEEDFIANPCEPPDVHFMEAAQGWLELGDAASALAELAHLNPSLINHPDVLLLSWDIRAALGHWSEAFDIGEELMRVIPDDIRSVLNRSTALRYMPGGGLRLAYDDLLRSEYGDWQVLYLLARYACQLGKLDEARQWLRRAGSGGGLRETALDEPDLEPIWAFVDQSKW
jgi:tetratricopeptide (TPR) repeat protein